MNNFTQVFETHLLNSANLVKFMLEEHGVNAVVMNNIASQYHLMQDKASVFVANDDLPLATKLMEQFNETPA